MGGASAPKPPGSAAYALSGRETTSSSCMYFQNAIREVCTIMYIEYSGEEGPKHQNFHLKSNKFLAQKLFIHLYIWKVGSEEGKIEYLSLTVNVMCMCMCVLGIKLQK